MIVLDTNVLSEPLRQRPHAGVVAWLDAQAVETLYVTTVSVAELRFGVAALPEGKRRQTLHDRIEGEVLPAFAMRILSFDEDATVAYAALRAEARAAGQAIGDFDALIAAIARTRGFAVATRDTAPFRVAGVAVIDPFG
ncbi:MAG: type II toxin-antitoxin system VapC family toxin [Solirubrobacterales bacterium]